MSYGDFVPFFAATQIAAVKMRQNKHQKDIIDARDSRIPITETLLGMKETDKGIEVQEEKLEKIEIINRGVGKMEWLQSLLE